MATMINTGASSNTTAKMTIEEDTSSTKLYVLGATGTDTTALKYNTGVYINASTGILMGAAWNDIAEFRCGEGEPGCVVCERDDGTVHQCEEDLAAGALLVSDTYGFIIGESAEATVPVTIAGRALVYHVIDNYHAGDAVCATYDGRVRRMTREEIREYPDRIIGYVSEIPSYDSWNGISVNDRIWVRVK